MVRNHGGFAEKMLLAVAGAWVALWAVVAATTSSSRDDHALISTTNILLPPTAGIFVPVRMSRGCWVLSSVELTNAAFATPATLNEDDMVLITPMRSSETEDRCDDPANEDLDDGDCYREFRVQVKEKVRYGSQALIFRPRSDPNSRNLHMEMRVDVRVDNITKLEILTTTKRIEIGEKEVLQVIARDSDSNVFSTLNGLDLQWKVEHPGTEYVSMSSLTEANIISSSSERAFVDKSKQSVLGLSTGRAFIAVSLGLELNARVELIVSRLITVCPGTLVGLIEGSSVVPSFCLRKIGCFETSKQFLSSPLRTSKDVYEWKDNPIEYKEQGKFIIQVEDKKEPTNRAFSQVFVGPLTTTALFVAPSHNATIAQRDSSDECEFTKSAGFAWPPISRLLPEKPKYRTSTRLFVLIRNKPYVFLGLAGIANAQEKDSFVNFAAPHTHERFEFKFPKEFLTSTVAHAMQATPSKSGDFPIKMIFRGLAAEYILRVVDEVSIVPSPFVLMTHRCEMGVTLSGGSGIYKSRLRPLSQSISLANLTTLRSSDRADSAKLIAWDEQDETNSDSTEVRVLDRPSSLSFRQGARMEVVVGQTFQLDIEAFGESNSVKFACCSLESDSFREESFSGEQGLLLPHIGLHVGSAAVCASKSFDARRIGETRVRYSWYDISTTIEINIVPALFANPPSLQLALGDEAEVELVGGSDDGRIFVNDNSIVSARIFRAKCEREGLFVFPFVSQSPTLGVLKTEFKLECHKVAKCAVELYDSTTGVLVTPSHILGGLRVDVRLGLYSATEKRLRFPSFARSDVSVRRGTEQLMRQTDIASVELLTDYELTRVAENIAIRADSKPFGVGCERKVMVGDAMVLVAPVEDRVWTWRQSECRLTILVRSGSHAYSSLVSNDQGNAVELKSAHSGRTASLLHEGGEGGVHFSTNGLVVSSKEVDRDFTLEQILRDEDFYPPTSVALSISFLRMAGITIAQSPSFAVQNAIVRVRLSPFSQHATSAQFDWSWLSQTDVKLSWFPSEAFELIERPALNEYLLRASSQFEGTGVFKAKICLPCKSQTCMESADQEFIVERHRSVVLLPGSKMDLTTQSCLHGTPLLQCRTLNATTENAVSVFENGTLVAGCMRDQKVLVECLSGAGVNDQVYFDVYVDTPSKVELYPFNPSVTWTLGALSEDNSLQIQSRLMFKHRATCQLIDPFALAVTSGVTSPSRFDTYDLVVTDDTERSWFKKSISTSQGVATIDVHTKRSWPSPVFLTVTTRIGETTDECAASRRLQFSASSARVSILLDEKFEVLSPKQVLLPPGARYQILSKGAIAPRCRVLSNCGCDGHIQIVGTCLLESFSPMGEGETCVIEIVSSPATPLVKHLVLVDVKSVGGLNADVSSSHRELALTIFDEVGRNFSQGWYDSDRITRLVEFEPSKHVQIESRLDARLFSGSGFSRNMSRANALEGFRVTTTAKKASTWLKITLKEDSRTLGVALIEKIERKCERLFLGYFCVDGYELTVLAGIALAAILAVGQDYANSQIFVVMGVVAVYFAAF